MTKRTDQEIQDLAQQFSGHAGNCPAGHQAAIQQMFEGTMHARNVDLDAPPKRKADPKIQKRLSLAVQATTQRAVQDEEAFPVLVADPPPKAKAAPVTGKHFMATFENRWNEAEKKAKAKK